MKRLSSATFQLSVAPQSGADATVYWLVPSVTQVKRKADGTHLPEYVSCESKSKTGESSPVSGIGTIRYAIIYLTGETTAETVYQSRIAITPHMAGISFRLYVGGQKLDEKTVLIIDDGGRGDTGDKGPMLYPAGIWDENTTYTATKNAVPFVLFEPGNMFYMMNREKASVVTGGANPAEDYAEHGDNAIWLPFENYRAIFTEILMAKFAKLAGAVFWGNYMFSQYGKDGKGNDTDNYKDFDPNYPDNGGFIPNYYLNTKTGKAKFDDLTATGSFTSTPILVTTNEESLWGGNFSSKSGIYAASVPRYSSKYQYGYGTLIRGFMLDPVPIKWSNITITNVSNTPLYIDANHGMYPPRTFTYNGKMYYGVRFTSKYKPVRFMLLKVPSYQLELGNGVSFMMFDRIIQVDGNGLTESTINYHDGKTYSILQI